MWLLAIISDTWDLDKINGQILEVKFNLFSALIKIITKQHAF